MTNERLPAVNEVREVTYNVGQERLTLTIDLVRRYCVQGHANLVTESELAYFLHECKARQLNPLRRECYLIKYSRNDNAQIIEAIGSKRNRARRAKDCKGWQKGILLLNEDGEIIESKIPIVPPGKTLIGGFFRATPDGWSDAFEHFVDLNRYVKKTREGNITAFWQPDKQAEMIRKVAESQGLTALWGDEVGQSYIAEEFPPDAIDAVVVEDDGNQAKAETETPKDVGTEIYQDDPRDENPKPKDDPERRERRPTWTARNSPREDTVPQGNSAGPIFDPPKDEEPPPATYPDEEPPPETEQPPANWWNRSKNWRHRRGHLFYFMLRIGLGLPFAVRNYAVGEDGAEWHITEEMVADFNKIKIDFPDAVGTLRDARTDIKKAVFDKMRTALHFTPEAIENFKAEIQLTE